jgi:hypothetical protein
MFHSLNNEFHDNVIEVKYLDYNVYVLKPSAFLEDCETKVDELLNRNEILTFKGRNIFVIIF